MVEPRIAWIPKKGSNEVGKAAVELAREAGLKLDEWQAYVLQNSLRGTKEKWDAAHVGLNVARQNGKGAIIEARMLAEMFIVGSPLTIYSAHNFDTALEHFRRITFLIEDTPSLSKQLIGRKGSRPYGITFGKGNEGVELRDGRRLRFRTRTAGGGRGFSCDCLILDEAMFLPEFTLGALLPVISAKPNPQVWYVGSSVDQQIHEHGIVFARVRERAAAQDPDLAYFEWSVEADSPDLVPRSVLKDRDAWEQANPSLGIRIQPDYIESEIHAMDARTFAVERLGVGDWPRTDLMAVNPIDLEAWDALEEDTKLQDPVCFAFDVSPDRQSSVSAAGRDNLGNWRVEVVTAGKGTAWLPDELARLQKKHSPAAIVCDGFGPASSIVAALEERHIEVQTLSSSEHGQACGRLVDAVNEGSLRHGGGEALNNAVRSARTRPLGDAWAWSRKSSSVNISPLVSATLALSAAMTEKPKTAAYAWA